MKITLGLILFIAFVSTVTSYYHQDSHYFSFQSTQVGGISLYKESGGSTYYEDSFTITDKGLKQLRVEKDEKLEISSIAGGRNWTFSFWFQFAPTVSDGSEVMFSEVNKSHWQVYYHYNQYISSGGQGSFNSYVFSNQPNHIAYVATPNGMTVIVNGNIVVDQSNSSEYGRDRDGYRFMVNENYSMRSDIFITDLHISNTARSQSDIQAEINWYANLPTNLGDYYFKFNAHGSYNGNYLYNYYGNHENIASYIQRGEVTNIEKNQIDLQDKKRYRTLPVPHLSYTSETVNLWVKITEAQPNVEYHTIFYMSAQNTAYLYVTRDGRVCFRPQGTDTYCATGYGFVFLDYWTNFTVVMYGQYTIVYVNGQKVQFSSMAGQPIEVIELLPLFEPYIQFNLQINHESTWSGYVDDLFVKKTTMSAEQVYQYFNQYKNSTPQCAVITTECGYAGESQEICGHTNSISLHYMRSIYLPPGKKITLFTGAEFTGEYQVFTESVECQELVYIPQEEEQSQ